MGRAGELIRRVAVVVAALLVGQVLGIGGLHAAGAQVDNVMAYGDAVFYGSTGTTQLSQPVVGMAALPSGQGYWLATKDGTVFAFGSAVFYGQPAASLHQPNIVGIASTPSGLGYWVVGSDGGVFAYGDAPFYGSTGNLHLNSPMVGLAPTRSGHGYYLVGADGGIFALGDAMFLGSTGSMHLVQPIVGMAVTAGGMGYWLVASDGGVFAFGEARYMGSAGNIHIPYPIVAIARTHSGAGYWLADANGGIYSFGDAVFYGSPSGSLTQAVVGMAANPADGLGYWIVSTGSYPAPPPPPPKGAIAGVVQDASGTGLKNICVDASDASTPPGGTPSVTGTYRVETSVTGSYQIDNVTGSQYRVEFQDCNLTGYLPQWFNGKPSAAQADLVSVTPGSTTSGINANLLLGGSIAGTVTDGSAGPVSGICVTAFDTVTSASYGAATSVTGTYRVTGLTTGQYDVQFQDCSRRGYATQWYSGKPDRAGADPVSVTQGATTSNIDAHLTGGPPPDSAPPTITSSLSPPPNGAGWNNSPATLAWTVTDDTSVASTSGCGTTTVFMDTAFAYYVCTATDIAGLTSSASQIVRVDRTPPNIAGGPTWSPSAYGWYSSPVTVRFSCYDGLSGVASCPPDVRLASEGAQQSAYGTARDVAGNVATTSVSGINIDMTPPTITGTPTRPPNQYGWYQGPVTIQFACSDGLSGIAFCTPAMSMASEGANQYAFGFARDRADNGSSTGVFGVNIDMTPPTITAAPTTRPNANGWYSGPVTVAYTCSDSLSGVADCPPPVTLNSDGAGQAVSGTAVDKAGNAATTTLYGINIDTRPPTTTIDPTSVGVETPAASTPVGGTASDGLSGVDTVVVRFVPGNPFQTPTTVVATLSCDPPGRSCTWSAQPPWQPGTYTVQAHAVDKAGNPDNPGPSASLTII